MKQFLALFLVVYFLAEVSAKPAPQSLDQARDIFDRVKEKFEDAIEQVQEAASRAMETAKNAMQNGFHSAAQTAQSKLNLGEQSIQGENGMAENTAAA